MPRHQWGGRRHQLTPRAGRYGGRVSVYVDHAFAFGDWGRWSGGGHLQADTLEELHAFAGRMGLRPQWFQTRPGRPENDHYDLTEAGRVLALEMGAIAEDRRSGTRRRQAIREARRVESDAPSTSSHARSTAAGT